MLAFIGFLNKFQPLRPLFWHQIDLIGNGIIGTAKRIRATGFIVWALCLCLPGTLSAQIASDKGWFTADFNAGCAPFDIVIEHTGVRSGSLFVDFFGDPNDPFSGFGFGDITAFGAGETRTNASPYTSAGTYLIRVVDQSNLGDIADRMDFLEVTVTEPTTPALSVALCNNNQVLLTFDFNQDSYDFYEIDFGDGMPPTTLEKTGGNTINHPYPVEATYTINVSGRLNNGANTSCGDATPITVNTLQNIPSPNISSMTVTDAITLDFTYETLLESVTYALYQSENGGAFTQVATLDPATNATSFQHVSTQPNVNFNFGQFAFRIQAIEPCNNTSIESNTIQNIRAGFMAAYNGPNLVLDRMWSTQDPESELSNIDLVYGGSPEATPLTVTGTSSINLNSCQSASPFFFQATFGTALSRSITITPNLTVNTLTPTAPTGLAGQVTAGALELTYDAAPFAATEYRIYRIENNSNQLVSSTTSLNFRLTDFTLSESEVCFVVTYVDECGHESTPSEPACFQFTPSITLPNAFTPNGDPFNNTFSVPHGIFLNFRMEIYNRWGSLIFVTNDAATGWDGNVNGKPAPRGGYVYRINYNSGQGSSVTLSGSFTLIR